MSPRRWSAAVPPGTTTRHAHGARPRLRTRLRRSWRAVQRAGSAAAVAVAVVGLAGGAGAAAAVQALDTRGLLSVSWAGATVAAVAAPGAAPSRSGSRAVPAGLVPGIGRDAATGAAGSAGSAGSLGTVARDLAARRVAGEAADVGAAAGLADQVEVAAQGLSGDVRPLPVPTLVPAGTVGEVVLSDADRADGVLSVEVPESGSGVLDVVAGSAAAPGSAPVRTVRVEVEQGLPVDGPAFAATVMATLNDPRGWGARGAVAFARTDGPADLRVVLASPAMVDALCAPLRTDGQVSCGRNGHAALNVRRWVGATDEFTDRHLYRQYLVNHEVGHLLGHPHEDCPGAGLPAPIMQQQSYVVAPCTPNGWPYP